MYKKIKKIVVIILEALVLIFGSIVCCNDFLNGRVVWGVVMAVSISLWIIIDISKIISIIKYKKDSTEHESEIDSKYELGCCPRCQKADLITTENKIICKSCGDWTWIEDAYNSSWLKDISEEINND